MEHPYEHIVDLILAFLIIFLFPILYFGLKLDAITQIIVQSETSEFVQDIRSKGYIDKEMYESYLEQLSKTDVLLDICMENRRQNMEPEYRFRTSEEVINEQNDAYTGTNEYNYRPVSTEIPNVKDPIDNSGGLNTETNESMLENAVKTPANPTHAHTDACYDGTRHVHTGSSLSGGGCYTGKYYHSHSGNSTSGGNCYSAMYHSHNMHCYGKKWCPGRITSSFTCSSCGMRFAESATVGAKCGASVTDYSNLTCTKSTSTVDYWYLNCGKSEGQITGYYIKCDKKAGAYYNGNIEVFPHCNRKVIDIVPTHPKQKVYLNEPLITTATATYQDGSTDMVLCSTAYTTNSVVNDKTATLTYKDETETTFTKTIIVSVIPRNKTCANGHVYNMRNDNTDPGCPFCRAYLKSLIVSYPTSGKITIYKGTTLQENAVTLLATYMDGRNEYLTSGYVDNLDKNYVGMQTVTLSYKGKYTTLIVTTKRNIRRCPICNRHYELYPDNTDPGCPYCAARTPVFTGNVLEYENKYYEFDIFKELYEGNGSYYFSNRDYFTVTVTNRTGGRGMGLLRKIFKGSGDEYIHVADGGYIREEIQK
ncbi:MAG: hypothetical protein E7255_10270 [Lachnospiraceae bacterium]|nr:hypothetical protein [Lachnospiraceae bacterium]